MKCKNCNTEMVLEEFYTDVSDSEKEICLRDYLWCPTCDITAIKYTYYKKEREEITYDR